MNGLEQLLRDIDHPELIGEGLSAEVATAIADNYGRPSTNGHRVHVTPGRAELGRVDLGPVVRGEKPAKTPGLVCRDDGIGTFYPGDVHDLHGEPGHGKTWFTYFTSAEVLRAGGSVGALDYEGTPHTFVERLRALGVDDEVLCDESKVAYHNLLGKSTAAHVSGLVTEFTEMGVSFVTIDAMLPALVRNGLDDNSNSDLAAFYEDIARPLTVSAAVVTVDHLTKDAQTRGRGARGAGAKLQLVDVSYKVKLTQPFSKTKAGAFQIVCAKDRNGTFAIGETVADVHLTPAAGGTYVELDVRAPDPGESDKPFRPTRIMQHISMALEENGEMNTNSVRMASRGNDKVKPLALDLLVNEGYIERRTDGQMKLYRSVRPYREDTDRGTEGDRG